jgi:uncharacterized membrane protein
MGGRIVAVDPKPTAAPRPAGIPEPQADSALPELHSLSQRIKGRMLGGLLLVLPILITLWVVQWLYSSLEEKVIDPLALLVLWKVRQGQADAELPYWFETYAAPLIAIILVLVLLYFLGFFLHSRLRRAIDWVLLRLPVISVVYNGVRNVFQALDRQRGQQRSQRVVLIPFPHPGLRAAGFVTATCRDVETQKVLLCVFVPQSPLPTNGHMLLVPEEDATDLNWSSEETLQALISGGFTAPPEITYFNSQRAVRIEPVAVPFTNDVPPK